MIRKAMLCQNVDSGHGGTFRTVAQVHKVLLDPSGKIRIILDNSERSASLKMLCFQLLGLCILIDLDLREPGRSIQVHANNRIDKEHDTSETMTYQPEMRYRTGVDCMSVLCSCSVLQASKASHISSYSRTRQDTSGRRLSTRSRK